MSKYRFELNETLKYRRTLVIEKPQSMDKEFFESILDNALRVENTAEDVANYLERHGVIIHKYPGNDFRSPWDTEVEEWDFEEIPKDE